MSSRVVLLLLLPVAYSVTAGACGEPFSPLPVLRQDSRPAWSPDGQWLAFEHEGTDSAPGLYVARVDGSQRRLVVPEGHTPDWSPDGSRLVFGIGFSYQLFTIDLATDSLTQLTTAGFNVQAAWSPDGQTIAFVSDGVAGSGSGGLWLMQPDGAGLRRLPFENGADGSSGVGDPDWAPAGDRLVTAGIFFPAPQHLVHRLFIGDTLGSDTTWLTSPSTNVRQPAWSPTGEWIAYANVDGSQSQIRVIRPDGSDDRLIVAGGGNPTWSPDGQRVAFSLRVGDEIAIWSVDLNGGNLQQLTWPAGRPTS